MLCNEQGNTHYCLISDVNHLMSHLTKHKGRAHYCRYCLHRFYTERTLQQHLPLCIKHGAQKTRMPTEEEKWMAFKNHTLTHKVPFTIIADFESFVTPLQDGDADEDDEPHPVPTLQGVTAAAAEAATVSTPEDRDKDESTRNVAKHEPSGYCYVVINGEGRAEKPPQLYTGPNVVEHFLDSLLEEAAHYLPIIKTVHPICWSEEEREAFGAATICHLCRKPLPPLGPDRVWNHCHLTGRYLGAAHRACNLNYKMPTHIPVFFHNLRGYDVHHLMQGFGRYKEERMNCIARNSEQYVSVSLGALRFLDTLQFMPASLEKLVGNLTAADGGPANFRILRQVMGDDHLDLLLRKGVFPYTWMTDAAKLRQPHLPPPEAFYNDLSQAAITEEEYAHAQRIWTAYNMSTMQDYHDVYLKTDVLLLADVFQHFRNTAMDYYGIDPCNVYSAPGLAWQAMLRMTDVRLELLTDVNQHLFIESGIRGGVAMIPHRHAKANNPLLPDTYNPEEPTSYLLHLDCNNLYGTAMCQPLPQREFKWMSQEEISRLDVTQVPDDAETGYILEVDLHYPDRLHDLHSDYPLAPERGTVTPAMLSPYCRRLLDHFNLTPGKVPKLLTTLSDKNNYVVHYRALKLYLELGLELRRVHRVLSFRQSAWLAPFITYNTEKRKAARNEFEKDFFKLMNNAVYGKSLENVRSRKDFKLVANERDLIKWTASPRLKTFFPYTKDLAGLNLKKATILLDRPVYVGLTVLDLSKVVMYNFHYHWTVRKYGSNVRLCMTDTDSFFYHIRTANVYEDMRSELHRFDTSDYPPDHPNYSAVNKKVLGKFKDETCGKPAREIIGLRAKCYSVLQADNQPKKVAKGVPRVAIRYQLKHQLYRRCLFNRQTTTTTAKTIGSRRHRIYTRLLTRLSLTPYDDKRYVLDDGVGTLAYGHHRIHQPEDQEESTCPPAKRRRMSDSGATPSSPSTSSIPDDTDLMELVALLEQESDSDEPGPASPNCPSPLRAPLTGTSSADH